MKKFLLALVCGYLSCMAMFAQTYTETILVEVNGTPAPETTNTIEVTKHDNGTCDFLLRNFVLKAEPDPMFPDTDMSNPVGNINLKNVKMVDKGGYYEISTEQTIQIEAGDDPTLSDWLGPQLPPVPIVLNGTMDKEHINAAIQINLMIMQINVTIGKGVDNETAIHSVTAESQRKAVYDLNGIRVAEELNSSIPAGAYIVGGKKVIVK